MVQEATGTQDGQRVAFDRADLLDSLDGDEELMAEIIEMYLSDTPVQVAILRKAVEENDALAAERQAHKIKGASANIRAGFIREMLADVEKAAKQKDLKRVIELLEPLDDEFDTFRKISTGG